MKAVGEPIVLLLLPPPPLNLLAARIMSRRTIDAVQETDTDNNAIGAPDCWMWVGAAWGTLPPRSAVNVPDIAIS